MHCSLYGAVSVKKDQRMAHFISDAAVLSVNPLQSR